MHPIATPKPPFLVPLSPQCVKNEFEEIISRFGQDQAKELCWKKVTEQKNGNDVLIAAKVFSEIFSPVKNELFTFEFSEGSLNLTLSQIEALKKDSQTLRDFLDDVGGKVIPLSQISKAQFLTLLNILYPNEPFEKEAVESIDTILAANFLDVKQVMDTISIEFQFKIDTFKEEKDLTNALDFLQSIQMLPKDLRLPFELKMASYFGKMLQNASSENRNEILKKYQVYKVSALSFRNTRGVSLNGLNQIPSLKVLDLMNTNLEDKDLKNIPESITSLNLEGCMKVTNEAIATLPRGLKSLSLNWCYLITDKGIEKLPQDLVYLNLGGCDSITDEGIGKLPQGIVSLNLGGCSLITDRGLSTLRQNLNTLSLAGCKLVTDEGISNLQEGLRTLNLSGCALIKDKGIAKLPRSLKSVDLSGCELITDEGIGTLPRSLKSVDLSGCELITDEGIEKLPKNLVSAVLDECRLVTDNGLTKLPQGITHLGLYKCKKITDKGIKNLPLSLASIDINGCNFITDEGKNTLKERGVEIKG